MEQRMENVQPGQTVNRRVEFEQESKANALPSKRKVTLYRKKSVEHYDFYFGSVEEVLSKIGIFGPYQIFCCSVTFFSAIAWFANYVILFYGMTETAWTCTDPIDNATISSINDKEYFCQIMDSCFGLKGVPSQFASLTAEWKLVCNRKVLIFVLLICFLVGRIVGAIIGGHLSDNFGRTYGLFLMHSFGMVVRALSIASTDWPAFAVFQFITGAIFGQIQTACMTLLTESTDGAYRYLPIACAQLSAAYVLFALILYLTAEWRMYLIIVSLISAPLLYGYILFQESPRWLLVKSKTAEAAQVITELYSERWRGRGDEVTPVQLTAISSDRDGKKLYTLLDLFHTKKLAMSTAALLVSVISISAVNASLLFLSHQAFMQNFYVHFLLAGALRLFFLTITILLSMKVTKLGCRHVLLFSLATTIVCFAAVTIILLAGQVVAYAYLTYGIVMFAFNISGSVYHLTVLHTVAVVYPTVVRGIAFGFFISFEDLGTILIGSLIEEITRVWAVIPCIIVEIVLVITLVVSIWYIPETKYAMTKRLLPNTFADLQ
ncbi:Sugar tr domain containing protein [Trichuris trichiura]|uniref:Sugar tr domain containing protein n=1 Tax=Trichuris trichiura TaxID=36087 RepID=A0A077Z2G8_TRITR|nr:Sugar tr domain containing protein [Trichuris trichiura]